jgi:hypothetical protein
VPPIVSDLDTYRKQAPNADQKHLVVSAIQVPYHEKEDLPSCSQLADQLAVSSRFCRCGGPASTLHEAQTNFVTASGNGRYVSSRSGVLLNNAICYLLITRMDDAT